MKNLPQELEYLNQIGRIWKTNDFPKDIVRTEWHDQAVKTVSAYLKKTPPRSVLISGESGVGKSVLIQLIARYLKKSGWMIFTAAAADVMAGQRYIGDLEQQVKNIIEALSSKSKQVWIIPQFHELYYTGRHEQSPIGILDLILPYIQSGKIIVIGEIQYIHQEKILQYRPGLRSAMDFIQMEAGESEPSKQLASLWLEKISEQKPWVNMKENTLSEIDLMIQQYFPSLSLPGRLIDFIKSVIKNIEIDSSEKLPKTIGMDQAIDTLSMLSGLPSVVIDDRERLDLDGIRNSFSSRIIGQDEAINALVERIAMLKAGLTDPDRPVGVFLFVGPTGTGKTEVAKTLAQILFGSEERMIRMDMSELQTADDTYRILGDFKDTSESVALVNQIRKNPFSVVLLDEFEKAHPLIWDIFLQVFDDGRLTDNKGNNADFRHSIIIMTSNVGARVTKGSGMGFVPSEESYNNDHIQKALNRTFRPEFINRIDRIVTFNPLSRSVMRKILTIELGKILHRRGLRQKQWAVEWEDSAIEFLLEKGFTVNLGARPLKRAIDQHFLSPLAITIVNHQYPEGDQFLFVKSANNKLKVDFVDPDKPNVDWKGQELKKEHQIKSADSLNLKSIAMDPEGSLAEVTVLEKQMDLMEKELEELSWRDKKEHNLAEMAEPDFWSREDRYGVLVDLEFRDRFDSAFHTAQSFLDRLRGDGVKRLNYSPSLIQRLAIRLYLMKDALSAFMEGLPQDAYLQLSAENNEENKAFFDRISRMYFQWIKKRKMNHRVLKKSSNAKEIQLLLSVSGFAAYPILQLESGIHLWESPKSMENKGRFNRRQVKVRVASKTETTDNIAGEEKLAREVFSKQTLTRLKIVRRYRKEPSPLVRDSIGEWRTGRLDQVLDGNFDLFA